MKKWLNKRGGSGEQTALEAFIKTFYTTLLILLFIYIGYRILLTIIGGPDADALNNFNSLAENIDFMLAKEKDFDSQTMIFFIRKEHFVFGLNGPEKSGLSPGLYPPKCEGKPCLCIYENFDDFPFSPYKCHKYNESVIFHGYVLEQAGALESFRLEPFDLSRIPEHKPELYADYPQELYAEYGHLQLSWGEWRDLYLEKYVVTGRTHVLVAVGLGTAAIEQRVSLLADCPYNSDEECRETKRNRFISGAASGFCYYNENEQRCIYEEDIDTCLFDTKLTEDCLCGSVFVIVNNYADSMYCFNRADGKIFLLPFDCKSEVFKKHNCYGYCKAITDDKYCNQKEQHYCQTDPCQKGTSPGNACEVYRDGFSGNPKCRKHVPGTMHPGDPVGVIK